MIWSLDHQSPLRELVKWFLTSGVTGAPAFPACGRAAAQRGRKNEKISKKFFFQNFFSKICSFFTSFGQFAKENVKSAAPRQTFVKKRLFGRKKSFFCEIFPGHFFQKYDLRAGGGGPQIRREGRKIAVTPLFLTPQILELGCSTPIETICEPLIW